MAETLKTLGQAIPAAATLTALYTVPGATRTAVSTIVICNQGAATAKFRISIAIAGAADTPAQYIRYDVSVLPNDGFDVTIGVTLGPGDVIRVQSDTGTVSFNAFGDEVA